MQTYQKRPPEHPRRGVALVIAMVSLIIFGMVSAALMQTLKLQREVVRTDAIRNQSEWLVHSALNRTVTKLRRDPELKVDQWLVPTGVLGNSNSASVAMKVIPSPNSPQSRQVEIHLELRHDGSVVSRLTRSFAVSTK
jgi:type II secretory pathway component PulK